jgi:cell division inhibitor SulA
MSANDPDLESLLLRSQLWRGDRRAEVAVPSEPTGHASLDALLPGGGWPRAALTELLVRTAGIGELSLLAPMLARLSRHDTWIALVAPPHLPYAPALAAAGVALSRLLLIQAEQGADRLWAMEQALASGACSAVIGWPAFVHERGLRRLQLAAEHGKALGIFFSSGQATSSSLAALRLELHPAETSRPVLGNDTAPARLGLRVLKVRGPGIGNALVLDVRPGMPATPSTPSLRTAAWQRTA